MAHLLILTVLGKTTSTLKQKANHHIVFGQLKPAEETFSLNLKKVYRFVILTIIVLFSTIDMSKTDALS